MDTYGIERGEVLLSLQLVLTSEEQGQAGRRPAVRAVPLPARREVSQGQSQLRTQMRSVVPDMRARAGTVPAAPAASFANDPPPAPSRAVVTVDPRTGVGTLQALRRDLDHSRAWEDGPSSTVVAFEVEALDQIRLILGAQSAEEVLKGFVEVAPFTLGARDRVYRSSRDEFILLLPGMDDRGIEAARSALEAALRRFLSDRGIPEVRLHARRIDPAALAG